MKEVAKTNISNARELYNLTHERNYVKVSNCANGERISVRDYAIMSEDGELSAVIFTDGVKVFASSGNGFIKEFSGIAGIAGNTFDIVIEKVKSRSNREYSVPRWAE